MFTLWNRDNDHVMTMNFSVTYRVLIVLSTCQTNIGHFDFLLQQSNKKIQNYEKPPFRFISSSTIDRFSINFPTTEFYELRVVNDALQKRQVSRDVFKTLPNIYG